MNADEYTAAVRHRLGLEDDDPILSNEQILEDINYGLAAISSKRDWPWLYTESSDTAEYGVNVGLPGNFNKVVFVAVDGTNLISAGIADLARFRTEFGSPLYYSVAGDFFNFAPSVREGDSLPVVIGYFQNEVPLITSLDAPLLPDAYADWLIYEAAVRSSIRTNRTDRVAAWRDEAARWEKNVIEQVQRSGIPPRIARHRPSMWQDIW